jgi:hypothetical protein
MPVNPKLCGGCGGGPPPCIVVGDFICTAEESFVVSLPGTFTFGDCANSCNTPCSPSLESTTVFKVDSCQWLTTIDPVCIGGWHPAFGAFVTLGVTTYGNLANTYDPCLYWFVRIDLCGVALFYIKRILTSTDQPIGTYTLFSITTGYSWEGCVGATADETITVSL